MAESNVDGLRGEYRRLTALEVGVMIRAFREGQGIKRGVLAADANMSEKTLERADIRGNTWSPEINSFNSGQ